MSSPSSVAQSQSMTLQCNRRSVPLAMKMIAQAQKRHDCSSACGPKITLSVDSRSLTEFDPAVICRTEMPRLMKDLEGEADEYLIWFRCDRCGLKSKQTNLTAGIFHTIALCHMCSNMAMGAHKKMLNDERQVWIEAWALENMSGWGRMMKRDDDEQLRSLRSGGMPSASGANDPKPGASVPASGKSPLPRETDVSQGPTSAGVIVPQIQNTPENPPWSQASATHLPTPPKRGRSPPNELTDCVDDLSLRSPSTKRHQFSYGPNPTTPRANNNEEGADGDLDD